MKRWKNLIDSYNYPEVAINGNATSYADLSTSYSPGGVPVKSSLFPVISEEPVTIKQLLYPESVPLSAPASVTDEIFTSIKNFFQTTPEPEPVPIKQVYTQYIPAPATIPEQIVTSIKSLLQVSPEPEPDVIAEKYVTLSTNVGATVESSGTTPFVNGQPVIINEPVLTLKENETPVVAYIDPAITGNVSSSNSDLTKSLNTTTAKKSSDKTIIYMLLGGAAAGILFLLFKK